MRFECDNCNANYFIDDAKVGTRGVKVRCKKCEHLIIVRPPAAADTGAAPETPDAPAAREEPTQARAVAPAAMSDEGDFAARTEMHQPSEGAFDTTVAGEAATEAAPAPMSFGGEESADTSGENTPDAPPTPVAEQDEPPAAAAEAPTPAAAPVEAPSAPAPDVELPPAPGEDVGLDDELAGAFDAMFEAGPSSIQPSAAELDDDPASVMTGFGESTGLMGLDSMEADTFGALAGAPSEAFGAPQFGSDMADEPSDDDVPDFGAMPEAGGASTSDTEWFIAIGDDELGPMDEAALAALFAEGRARRSHQVWCEGMDDWTAASDVPALASIAVEPSVVDDDDPFANVPDASPEVADPSWRPHGLTEVYQAAQLAEARADVSAKMPAAKPSLLAESEPEDEVLWRPGAARDLAALVESEMESISTPPPAADDDDLPSAPAAGGFLGMASDEDSAPAAAAPAFGGPASGGFGGGLPLLGAEPAAPAATPAPAAAAPMPVAPAPLVAPPAARPAWFWPLISAAGVAVVAVIAFLAFGRGGAPTPAPAPVATNPVAPAQPAVAVKQPAQTAPAQPVAQPGQPVATAQPAVPAQPAPAQPSAQPSPAQAPAQPAPVQPAAAPVAVATAPVAKPKPKPKAKPRSTRRRPKPRAKPTPKPKTKAKSKGCDPVLDFDCDAPAARSSKPAKKSLSKTDILLVVKKNLGTVNKCARKHGARGTVKVRWDIRPNGRTTKVAVKSTKYSGTPVASCIVRAVKRWKFPAFSGSKLEPVTIPFKLKG